MGSIPISPTIVTAILGFRPAVLVFTLLLTGASGFLGSTVCRIARGEWQVIAVGRNPAEGVHQVMADLSVPGFAQGLPVCDAVVHMAAEARLEVCERDPVESRKVNVEATRELSAWAAGLGVPFVFTSTDLVFGGGEAPYGEDAEPDPVSEYGRQKAEAERAVMEVNPEARIVRLSLLFDINAGPHPHKNFLSNALDDLNAGKTVTCYHDEWRTPLWVKDAARAVLRVLMAPPGIYHAGGPERLSRLEMVKRVLRMDSRLCGNDGEVVGRVKAVSRLTNPLWASRPEDVSLSCGKLKALEWAGAPLYAPTQDR